MNKNIVIVGAGLVGSLLSIFLARRGYSVKVFERRPDMRKENAEAGRSINLALSDRGLLALERLGLSEAVRKIAIPMHGRLMHHLDGGTAFQPYGKQGQFINSVSRSELNKKLMDLAEIENVAISFDEKCNTINWKENELTFESKDKKNHTLKSDLIFGADGAFSATRLQHQLQHDRFDYSQYYINCGYKELSIPAGNNDQFLMEKNALHIWPRKEYMLIALPNLDGSFTCTLFFPMEGPLSFASLDAPQKVDDFFAQQLPDVPAMIPDLHHQFLVNPVSTLVTIKCFPWIRSDRFALIGDAAHAIVPFFGQGMNCGFEDCRVLDELIEIHDHDWKNILEEFQQMRKPDADAIAEMAVENFIEMREKTADPQFLLQKRIEAELHEKYPDQWIPAYAQVTFNPGIRYSEALKKGRQQEKIMKEIMDAGNVEERWKSGEIETTILNKLSSLS